MSIHRTYEEKQEEKQRHSLKSNYSTLILNKELSSLFEGEALAGYVKAGGQHPVFRLQLHPLRTDDEH